MDEPDEQNPETLDSADPPPPFDPDAEKPWEPLHDPWFADPQQAQEWEGVSEHPSGPQILNTPRRWED